MTVRHVSAEGLALIKQWESLRLKAYRDGGGVLTIGWGHTSEAGPPTVTAGMSITAERADAILKSDIAPCEQAVAEMVKVPLSDNQFATLVSFVFNVGAGAFKKSTLLRKLNKGDYDGVPGELGKWVNDNGKRVQGLANRRAAEAGLWATGAHVASQYAPAAPAKVNALLTPEALGGGVAVGSAAFGAANNPGPLQIALAIAVVVAVALAAYWFIGRIRERNP